MHVRVIADVHHEAVEAMRAHDGHEWIDDGTTRFHRSRNEQAVAHEHEIAIERGRIRIRARLRAYGAGIARGDEASRGCDARGHEAQLETHGLRRVARAIRGKDVRQDDAIVLERRE